MKFAEGATKGDLLCLWLFQQTGIALASYIIALWPNVDEVPMFSSLSQNKYTSTK